MNDRSSANEQRNSGHTVFAAQGTQNIYMQLEHYFDDGMAALKNRMYPQVVEKFENFLSTANSEPSVQPRWPGGTPGAASDPGEIQVRVAQAHAYAGLGLLGRLKPSYHAVEVIRRVEKHLVDARSKGTGHPVAAFADVMLAIVKDDFYIARAMRAGDPQPSELRRALPYLDRADLGTLIEHMAPVGGETWKALTRQATEAGFVVPESFAEEKQRFIAPDRREKVIKYFTMTPDPVSPAKHIAAVSVAVLLVVSAIASQSFWGLFLVVGAGWLVKKAFGWLKVYRAYLKEYAKAEPKPSDQEMDDWLSQDIEFLTRRGARKLNLDPREEREGGSLLVEKQVVVGVPARSETRTGWPPAVRWGRDGQARADHYNVLILFLTARMISVYRCVLEFTTGNLRLEETCEYSYANIVGVSSASIPANGPIEELARIISEKETAISLIHQFRLSINGGESLQVTTGFSGRFENFDGMRVWRGNEHALGIIQAQVRSYHNR
jgi:hypothetical protein